MIRNSEGEQATPVEGIEATRGSTYWKGYQLKVFIILANLVSIIFVVVGFKVIVRFEHLQHLFIGRLYFPLYIFMSIKFF